MYRILFAGLLLFVSSIGIAQEVTLSTPTKEVDEFLIWLQKQPEEDRLYMRGLTSYAIPQKLRADAALQTSFLLHSLAGPSANPDGSAGSFYPLAIASYQNEKWDGTTVQLFNQISDTLFWIDIRNFNWTPEAWEYITKFDGYMVEPIVQHESNALLRLLAGNAVVRMDWFVYNASRGVAQVDRDSKNISIYRTLLYAQTKVPKTVDEFRKVWGLDDITRSRQLGNEFATIVTRSQNVSRHNRILFGYRTELGWLYQTYDVRRQIGKRDYVERFYEFAGRPPDTFDGGEIFATNQLKLQVYDLYDDKTNLADFADATIVRHMTDVLGDARVNVPHSCFDCHAAGPIPSENTLAEFLKRNGAIYYKKKDDQLRVERAYFSDRFEESIKENQELYAVALKKATGLKPEDNLQSYYRFMNWYAAPLNMEQVAFECGVSVDELKKKAAEGLQDINYKIPGRLALLMQTGEPIPRDLWEAENFDGIPGIFQQTMIVIYGLTKITTTVVQDYVGIVANGCNIYSSGSKVIKKIEAGTKVTSVLDSENQDGWVRVKLADGTEGWIESKNYKEK